MPFFSRRPRHHESDPNVGDEFESDSLAGQREVGVSHRRRGLIWGAAVLLLIVIGLGCWIAIGAIQAKSNLEQARVNAQRAKDFLLDGDTAAASGSARDAAVNAEAARDATHSLAWNVASKVPWLGSPLRTGQQITDVVLGLSVDVLRPAADVGIAMSPDQLYRNGRIDVSLLRAQEPKLSELSDKAEQLNVDAGAITDPRYVSILRNARTELQSQISELTRVVEGTAMAAKLGPSMMGADGPRTYFMGFQTNAEVRGTGGLLGAFGILRFNNGVPTVDNLASNIDLIDAVGPVDLGSDYDQQYGFANPFTDFRNSNMSPHFPYAAQIWKSMWAERTGTNVDGVIAIDPVALSYILGAVGPITMPDGEVVSKENVVELTESTAYKRFPDDQLARKTYLQNIANAVVAKITGPVQSPRQLLEALGKAASERRILIWSSIPEEQQLLEQTPLAHVIPEDPGPYAAIVLNNLGGNKLDYYLKSQVEYAADKCAGDTRASTVSVRLTNTVPTGPLPDYVGASEGLSPNLQVEFPRGTNVTSLRLFATKDAKLSAAILNGERVPAILSTERGHPVFEVQLVIPPGQTANVDFQLSEPTTPGTPRVLLQPLIDTSVPVVKVPECAR